MYLGNFELLNVTFTKKGGGHWVFISGEIANRSNKSYASAVFRMNIFEGTHVMWTGLIKVRNFRVRQTRPFEVQLESLSVDCIPRISKYEIFFETGY